MKKRFLAWVLALITLLSATWNDGLVVAKAETTGQELIVNGGFELDTDSDDFPDGWKELRGNKDNHYNIITEANENKALQFLASSSMEQPAITQEVVVKGDGTYTLSAQMKAPATNTGMYAKIDYYAFDSNESEWKSIGGESEASIGGIWNEENVNTWIDATPKTFTVPDNCTKIVVTIRAHKREVCLDNVSLIGPAPSSENSCEHTGETEIRDSKEATVSAEGYTGDIYCLECSNKIVTGTVIPKLQNLVVNGDFEFDNDINGIPDNWTKYKGDWTSYLGVEYLTSAETKAVKMSPDADQTEPGIQQTVDVIGDATYKLNLKVYSTDLNAYSNYKIFFYNAVGDTITSATMGAAMKGFWSDSELGTWKECNTVEITTPSECTSLTVVLYAKGKNTTIYFDDVSLIGPATTTGTTCVHAVGTNGTAATCSVQAVCGTCGEYFGNLDGNNHGDYETEIKNEKPATVTEEGYTGDVYCKGCDKEKSAGTVVPKLHELIVNGDFETDDNTDGIPDGWKKYKGDWTSYLGVEYLTSAETKAVKMSPNADQTEPGIQQQDISVVGGATYKLNLKVYSTDLNAYSNYKIFFYNAAGEAITSATMGAAMKGFWSDSELGTWKVCNTVEINTPAECTSLTIVLYAKGNDTAIYFDDVSLVGPAPANVTICAHEIGTTGTAATCSVQAVCGACGEYFGALDTNNHSDYETEIKNVKPATLTEEGYTGDIYCKGCNNVKSAGTAIPKLQELLVNGGFEVIKNDRPVDWVVSKGVKFEADAAIKNSGVSSLKLVDNGTSYMYATQTNIPVVGGETYQLSAKAFPVDLAEGSIGIKIECYNNETGQFTKLIEKSYNTSKVTLDTWNDLAIEFTIPDGDDTKINVLFRLNTGKEVYWDDVSIIGKKPVGSDTGSACTHTGGAADCGNSAICTVEGCGISYGPVNPDTHTDETELRNTKPATLTEEGYTGDVHCKGCGAFLSAGVAIPKAKELLRNPGLESFYDGKPAEWTVAGGAAGACEETITHTAESQYSLKLTDNGERNSYVTQSISLVPGTPYTVSAWVYPEDLGENGYFAIKLEYYGKNAYGLSENIGKWEQNFRNCTPETWNQIVTEFTPPEGTEYANVLIRMNLGKVGYFDDFSLVGQKPVVKDPLPSEDYIALEDLPAELGSRELLTNPSFEVKNSDGTYAEGWERIKADATTGQQYISLIDISNDDKPFKLNDEDVNTTAARINSTTTNNPWLRQEIYGDFKKGEVYQLSAWVRKETSGRFGFKLEYYDENKNQAGDGTNSDYVSDVTGEQWVQYVRTMTVPEDCANITFYFRMFSTGVTDVDHVSFYKIKNPDKITLNTDEIFYYEEEAVAGGWGKAEAFVDTALYPQLEGATITFRLQYGGQLITESANNEIINSMATFDFPLSLMEKVSLKEFTDETQTKYKWEAYTMEVAAVKDGQELAVSSRPIYVCPRPSIMNEEGRVVVNGEIFNPVLFYHVNLDQYDDAVAIGANVVQSRYETYSGIKSCLDEAALIEQNTGVDLKIMAALYKGMKPGGEISNQANTTEIISKLKDNDDLLGYMVMDEPSSNWAQRLDVFEDAYMLIRSLDPTRPVYMVEANPAWYETFQKYVDILGVDPYLQSNKKYQVEHVYDFTAQAIAATKNEKPVWCLTQLEKLGNYMPDENGIRNMFYQGLMGGASMIGFFPYYGCYVEDGFQVDLDDTGNDLNIKRLFMDTTEATDARKHFVDREYPVFAEKNYEAGAYWYSSYVKNGEVYVIAVNNSDSVAECSILLASDDNSAEIGAFTAEKIFGDTNPDSTEGDVISGDSVLQFTLEGDGAYVWKVTPADTSDKEALDNVGDTEFKDVYLTPWAAEAINKLVAAGLAEGTTATSFGVDQMINRGAFVEMLVNILMDQGVAVPSALNNIAYPEKTLSRKDMMAFIAIANGVSGAVDTGTFTTKSSTTRAEAAVILLKFWE